MLGVLVAMGVSLLLDPLSGQNWQIEVCIFIYTCLHVCT